MLPQVPHKPADILLPRPHQRAALTLQKLRKALQVPVIRLHAQRPQPLFHPQMRHILPQQPDITRSRPDP